jgi:hypothetical protein
MDRTLLRSWIGWEEGKPYRYEVRECPHSGVKVRARFPAPKARGDKAQRVVDKADAFL